MVDDDRAANVVVGACYAFVVPRDQTVMVVDDDPAFREVVCAILDDEGYATLSAEHGRDAIAQLTAGAHPDLLLLDLNMPVMSGWDFFAWVGASPWAETPVLLLTGSDASGFGAARVLAKSITPDALLVAVRDRLR